MQPTYDGVLSDEQGDGGEGTLEALTAVRQGVTTSS